MSTPSATRHSPEQDAGPLTGRTIGDFVVGRRLGRGGMGEVYLARQSSLDRRVALKVLRSSWDESAPEPDPITLARFEAEALAAASLSHPNIVHIYAIGIDQGIRFIAMEFVEGVTLRDLLDRHGRPDPRAALEIMRQTTRGVAAAGVAGLVHRDLKPENLLVTPDGHVKVADFGLCLRPELGQSKLTQPGVIPGTPMYMSPEQVQGRTLDHRSDIYSLGVTFYHLLAGEPPFRANNAVTLALKHVQQPPPPLDQVRPDLPSSLVQLIMRMLDKAPERRPATAAEVLRELDRLAEIVGTTTTLIPADATTQASALALPAGSASSISRPRRGALRPNWRWYAVGLPLALALGIAAGRLAQPAATPVETEITPPTLPGLTMEPWSEVVKLGNARAQYRHAQTGTPAAQRPAAWLAVPGRFPDDQAMVDLAYLQLIRDLILRGDAQRLDQLGRELGEGHRRLGQEAWQALSRLALAGAAVRRDDASGVLEQFRSWSNLELMDPAHAALALEITMMARRSPSGRGTTAAAPLARLSGQLAEPLQIGGPVARQAIERLDPGS